MAGIKKPPPPLEQRLFIYYKCYADLKSRRQYHANGPQPLAVCEIESYLRLFGGFARGTLTRKFARMIILLDNEELAIYYEKANK